MSRSILVILASALALALFSCGESEPAREKPAPAARNSRLAAIDPAGFDAGLNLPDFTRYWTDAESRNGNTYPVLASVTDERVVAARLRPDGEFELRRNGEFKAGSMYAVLSHLERLKDENWNESRGATTAALMLFADRKAPIVALLKVCRELASMQVGNFWLATRDNRDDAVRLLPLFVDVVQARREWYRLDQKEQARTARLITTEGESVGATDHGLIHLGDPLSARGAEMAEAFASTKVERVQFGFRGEFTIAHFARAAELVSPLGFKEVEPFWPLLDTPEDLQPTLQRRELATFDDDLGVADGLDVPTLSAYWRAVAARPEMPEPAEIDPNLPLLGVRVNADGKFATRARGADGWTTHEDDGGVMDAMREHAGEIDFNGLVSDLQVLLAVDRDTPWRKFVGVLEMMGTVRCFRLYVVNFDGIGPTLRLIDLSLPVSELPDSLAELVLKREGAVEEGNYSASFTVGEDRFTAGGSGFTAALTAWASEVGDRPGTLVMSLPLDEPCGTMFTVLNSLEWLRMKNVHFALGD